MAYIPLKYVYYVKKERIDVLMIEGNMAVLDWLLDGKLFQMRNINLAVNVLVKV